MEQAKRDVLSYNTERAQLFIPEYGRNVQNMINYAKRLPSKEERNRAVRAIIDVMGQLNPHLRDEEDYAHKLWTHLFIMSDFELDVDSPYKIPTQEELKERPQPLKYPKNEFKYGHFGHYAEEMIREAGKIEDKEEKAYMAEVYANLLKKNYLMFHTNNIENEAILRHLKELSNGHLVIEDEETLKSTKNILKQFEGNSLPKKGGKKHKNRKRKNK